MKDITKFPHHIDNAGEKISAKDINTIHDAVNNSESNIITLADESFSQKALYALSNNPNINSMFIDTLETPYKIFVANSQNIIHDAKSKCIMLPQNGAIKTGEFCSTKMETQYGMPISDVTIVVDHEVPRGARIEYYISTDGGMFYPIKENTGVVIKVPSPGNQIFLKAKLFKNNLLQTPKIFAWAILYNDPVVDKMSSINVDIGNIESTTMGDTTLVRDKTKGDRVVAVITPDSLTELAYDEANNMRLGMVTERNDDKIISETLNYGPYENSTGEVVTVLLGTTRKLETGSTDGGE